MLLHLWLKSLNAAEAAVLPVCLELTSTRRCGAPSWVSALQVASLCRPWRLKRQRRSRRRDALAWQDRRGESSGEVEAFDKEAKPSDEARPVPVEGTERNALLTSLHAQTTAKKASQEHREEAQRLLDEYKDADPKTKVQLLLSLRDKGVKNLAWTHQFRENITHDTTTETAATAGMFTRSKIFQINGLLERDLTEQEAAETLEDLLTEAETLYTYSQQHVPHARNRRLDRWYYKWAEGETSREVFGF